MSLINRRLFLSDVGNAMVAAGVGVSLANHLGATTAWAEDERRGPSLNFGPRESLAAMLQETPADKLLPQLVALIRSGTSLSDLLAAGALANARTFGGQDYIGFHTFMALCPAGQMSRELPSYEAALPVLKVLLRNTSRIQTNGGREHEVLHPIEPKPGDGEVTRFYSEARTGNIDGAERDFAAIMAQGLPAAYNTLQPLVEDEEDVHRVVLAWRAWDSLQLTGPEHAHTLLRQSVRYCADVECKRKERTWPISAIREQLPKLLDRYRLLEKPVGSRVPDDAWIESFSRIIYGGTRAQAAEAAAAALAEGIAPEAIGEAISLAATTLVLFDSGRDERNSNADKPVGSVHGDSVGVHASDAAAAWRSIAAVCNPRNAVASLIVAASHTAGQGSRLPAEAFGKGTDTTDLAAFDAPRLREELETAIRGKDQARACEIVRNYGARNAAPRPVFDVLLRHSTRADGALHAEKYYSTIALEFGRSRPAFRWRHLTALARVVASEAGRVAPGYEESRQLLGLPAAS